MTSIRPTRADALAVGDDLDRQLGQDRPQQSVGERLAAGTGGLEEDGVVGAHLTVDRDPMEGGIDRLSQGGVGVLDDGVGLDEAEHRRHARFDHPGALGLGRERDPTGPQGAALGPAVSGEDRVGELAAAAWGEPAGRLLDPDQHGADRQRHADRPGLRHGDLGCLQAERVGGPFAHRQRVGVALLAGLGVGVAGIDDGRADTAALAAIAADPDRSGRGRVAGQQQRGGHRLLVAEDQADVGLAAALEPAVGTRGAKARSQLSGVEFLEIPRRLHPARPEEAVGSGGAHRRPSVSSSPSIRLRFWTPWPDAPFQMLSIAEKARTRPRSSTVT